MGVHIVYTESQVRSNPTLVETPKLAQHYGQDFGAVRLPGRSAGVALRYLICDEAVSA